MQSLNLAGKNFGRLTAVYPIVEKGKRKWFCHCSCGKTTIVATSKLTSGHTQSCGCLQRERTSEASRIDLLGRQFGRLTVIKYGRTDHGKAMWKCHCICGNDVIVASENLIQGKTKSCGCIRKEKTAKLKYSHGLHGHPLYRCWRNMLDRCQNPKNKEFNRYGGRGINVCEEWKKFKNFYHWAIKHGYSEDLTIERVDNDLGYNPQNCIWADRYTQSRNRSDNHYIEFNGEKKILKDWADETGISESLIRHRLAAGWNVKEALNRKNTDNENHCLSG